MIKRLSGAIAAGVLLAETAWTGSAQAQDLKLATSLPSMEFPFFVHMQKELEAEAEMLGALS